MRPNIYSIKILYFKVSVIKKNIEYSKENTQFNSIMVNEIYLSLFSTSQIYSLQHKKFITEIQNPSDIAANKIIAILKSK